MANVPSLSVVRDQARPKKLGRYELEECLGVEGGRETYRARVRGLAGFDRIFAVKCLRRWSGSPISRADPFITTAKRMAGVTDARVARVLDADVIDGVAVAVTEFVHGLDLERFREWAQVSGELASGTDAAAVKWQKLVAYIGAEIAGGLAALHAMAPPFAHGGLSPRNVIATARGGIKLLDAGLAVAAQKGGEAFPQRSLAYAAPGPVPAEPVASGDVRALGAMLFEFASGELPPPGMPSAEARRLLETAWPAMAEFIASMLAEDPALRPRAAKAAEILANCWAEIPDASMVTEMAALVRNFSAFVADASPPGAPSSLPAEPFTPDRAPLGAAGLLSMPPPLPPASSGSFLSLSDAPTRVSADGGYASAIFQALPADAPARLSAGQSPTRVAAPPSRASAGPAAGHSPTMRSFAGLGTTGLPATRPPDPRAALPAKSAAPSTKELELPALLPTPVMSPRAPTAPAPRAPTAPAPRAPTAPAPRAPTAPAPRAPTAPPPTAVSSPVVAQAPFEPEPMAEAADWGARALAALGTQAGLSIALLPPGPGAYDAAAAQGEAPPPVSDPAIDEAFEFAPPPPPSVAPLPPSVETWLTPPPEVQGARIASRQAPAQPQPAHVESLEDDLVEEEHEPMLLSSGGGQPAVAEAEGVTEEFALSSEIALEPGEEPRPVLEATAFVADDDFASAPEPAAPRVAQAMPTPEARESLRSSARSAMKSHSSLVGDEADVDSWQARPSRAKKIAAVLVVAVAIGAGAAALMLGPLSRHGTPPGTALPKSRPRKAVVSTPVASLPAAPAAAAGKTAVGGKAAAETATPAARAAVGNKPTSTAALAPTAAPSKVRATAPVAPTPTPAAPAPTVAVVAAPAPTVAAVAAPAHTVAAVVAPASATPALAEGGAVRLRVASQPEGARVWINGEERGATPCAVDVKAGSARVVLVHAGYLSSQSTIEVAAGAKLEETLKPVEPPMTGEARFRAECQTTGKLPIVVDGKETGILCPYSKMRVEPGNHTIGVLVPATGKIHQKEITLSAGVRSVVFGD